VLSVDGISDKSNKG